MKFEIDGKEVTPLEYAKGVKPTQLKKVIGTIKKSEYDEYADRCRLCFERYLAGDIGQATWWSNHAQLVKE